MRPLLIGAVSLISLTWAGTAQAQTPEQDVAPPKVVPTLDTGSAKIAAPSPPPTEAQLPAVEPIIGDEEFEKSIPPIRAEDDAELDRPLESIAEFEKRMAAEAAESAASGAEDAADASAEAQPPQVDGVPVPALADGDAAEAIGDAPISDSELAAPLPPLENFDVEPVQFAEPEDDSDNVELSYAVQVNGLSDADDSTIVDLADLFGDLSALYDGDGKADNAAMIRARLSADGELMQRILASEGYYDAVVDTRIDRGPREEGQERRRRSTTAVIDVKPGKRYTLADIIIEADPTVPPNLIADNFPLSVGEPIVAQRIQGAEAAIALKLPEEGYPFAKVGQRDILLDGATGDGVYTLPVDIGKRSRFGGIETTGDLAFDAEHVEVLARFCRRAAGRDPPGHSR